MKNMLFVVVLYLGLAEVNIDARRDDNKSTQIRCVCFNRIEKTVLVIDQYFFYWILWGVILIKGILFEKTLLQAHIQSSYDFFLLVLFEYLQVVLEFELLAFNFDNPPSIGSEVEALKVQFQVLESCTRRLSICYIVGVEIYNLFYELLSWQIEQISFSLSFALEMLVVLGDMAPYVLFDALKINLRTALAASEIVAEDLKFQAECLQGSKITDEDIFIQSFGDNETGLCDPERAKFDINPKLLANLQFFLIFLISGQFLGLNSERVQTFHYLTLSKSTGIITDLNVVVSHLQLVVCSFVKQAA